MYQNGLTKIFFRAGMLAALESFRSDRLNAMVTVVQKNMRRRLAMKKYGQLRYATIKVQTWWRSILARRFVENIRREVSAIRLQTAVRCFIQRNYFLDTRHAFILLQSRKWDQYIIICISLTILQVFVASKHVNIIFKRGLLMLPPFFKVYYVACT